MQPQKRPVLPFYIVDFDGVEGMVAMSKKQLILPWVLAVVFAAGLCGVALANAGFLRVGLPVSLPTIKGTSVSSTSSASGGGPSAPSSASGSSGFAASGSSPGLSSSQSSSALSNLQLQSELAEALEKGRRYDIDLAALETQLMNSQSIASSRLEDGASFAVPPAGKYVYLTFDDGPSENTPGVLDVLKRNNVKATFFVVYNKNRDYYREIAASGQVLALHTYSHDYSKVYRSVDAYFDDLNKISDYVAGITGVRSRLVRLPGGSSNTISRHYSRGVMKKVTSELQSRGYSYFDWNAQCLDATVENITPAQILKNVKSFTSVNGRQKPFIMLLLHNGSTETATKEALQSIIDYYRAAGYTFETVSSSTPAVHQIIQN